MTANDPNAGSLASGGLANGNFGNTGSGSPHGHSVIFSRFYKPGEVLQFHPKLREWLEVYGGFPADSDLLVEETGCSDSSCPVAETFLSLPGKVLKIGKAKEKITKQDVVFSVRKQGSWK